MAPYLILIPMYLPLKNLLGVLLSVLLLWNRPPILRPSQMITISEVNERNTISKRD